MGRLRQPLNLHDVGIPQFTPASRHPVKCQAETGNLANACISSTSLIGVTAIDLVIVIMAKLVNFPFKKNFTEFFSTKADSYTRHSNHKLRSRLVLCGINVAEAH